MKKIKIQTMALLIAFLFTQSAFAQPDTYHVKTDGNDTNDGLTWTNAFQTVRKALSVAGSGDQVWVATGTYYPDEGPTQTNDTKNHSFVMKNNLAIYGGLAGTEDANFDMSLRDFVTNETILSGDIDQDNTLTNNSFHVISNISTSNSGLNNSAVLNGFTVTGGNATGSGVYSYGGGMYNRLCSPKVLNCTFSGNAAVKGGGIHNTFYSSPKLTNCTFSENSATGEGGGVYNNNSAPTVTNCIFSENSATDHGGGMDNYELGSTPTLTNCTFSGNSATSGGGMYNHYYASPKLAGCTFSGNTASNSGGGMYNSNAISPTVTNCTFSGNTASGSGGGMGNWSCAPKLTNCTFSGNKATVYGGGINNNTGSNPVVTNCTFSGNTANYSSGGMSNSYASPTVINCIFWGNQGEIRNLTNGNPTITYSIVKGGYTGTGNLNLDPLFVDQPPIGPGTTGDLHLQDCSPAIDAGDDTANTTTEDLNGNARKVDAIPGDSEIDMGAYEAAELGFITWYIDADADGYGSTTVEQCDRPVDGFLLSELTGVDDCNDNDATVHEPQLYYVDTDQDSYGSTTTEMLCSSTAPTGYSTNSTDCNDGDGNINPAAQEVCNGVDDNCDGNVDEGVTSTFYADSDGDGYGDPNSTVQDCAAPAGYVANADDCDDGDGNINPAVQEVCNGVDDNCDGNIDEGVTFTFYTDTDGDGYGDPTSTIQDCAVPAGYVSNADDCDDNDPNNFPGNTETCDGQDNDCDGDIDEGLSDLTYWGSVSFTTQAEIDAWPACYTSVTGELSVHGADITNVDGLSNLASVWALVAFNNDLLTDLAGLSGLTSVEEYFYIESNSALTSLDGLSNLASVGGVHLHFQQRCAGQRGRAVQPGLRGEWTVHWRQRCADGPGRAVQPGLRGRWAVRYRQQFADRCGRAVQPGLRGRGPEGRLQRFADEPGRNVFPDLPGRVPVDRKQRLADQPGRTVCPDLRGGLLER